MEIRDATPDDIEQVADIWRHYVATSIVNLEETPPATDQIRSGFDSIFASKLPSVVAEEGTSICGYAHIGSYNDRSGYRFYCEASVYLRHGRTGKGLGKQILSVLLQRLKAGSDKTQVIAKMSVLPGAAIEDFPSCRLHMALGFRDVGRLKNVGYKFHQWIDVVIMQLDLESVNL